MKKRLYILFSIIFLFFVTIFGFNYLSQRREVENTHNIMGIMGNFNNVLELTVVNHKKYLENRPTDKEEPPLLPLPPVIDNETNIIEETVRLDIDFMIIQEENQNIFEGNKKVTHGKKGVKEVVYIKEYKDGELVQETIKSEKVISEPINEIVEIGVKPITDSNASLVFEGSVYNKDNTIFAFFENKDKCENWDLKKDNDSNDTYLCEDIQANRFNHRVVVLRKFDASGAPIHNSLNYNITLELYSIDYIYYIYGN